MFPVWLIFAHQHSCLDRCVSQVSPRISEHTNGPCLCYGRLSSTPYYRSQCMASKLHHQVPCQSTCCLASGYAGLRHPCAAVLLGHVGLFMKAIHPGMLCCSSSCLEDISHRRAGTLHWERLLITFDQSVSCEWLSEDGTCKWNKVVYCMM